MHCEHPTCVSVCPVGAFSKRESGAVVWDTNKCFGCRYCMVACPWGIPTFEWDSYNPRIRKCVLCYERIEAGRPTACAEACPTEATLFGDREQLIEIAKNRIRAQAENYQDHLLGLTEVGGTSVLYLSAIPFSQLGFKKEMLQDPPPEATWRILEQVPNVLLLGGWVLGGFYWIYRRREQVQAAEAESEKGGHE
jgi:formate dehydrogenase iron-sulfur subunit